MPKALRQQELPRRDLYEVLDVPKTASADQIKSAYRKLALRFHPDKNCGPKSEQAAKAFQEVSAAYTILSDPTKRQKYDRQGFAGVETAELDLQVDVTSLNLFSTVAASLFTNLGVTVKTSLPAKILDVAAAGTFDASDLKFGQAVEGRIDKAQANFYMLSISRQDIEQGFIIGAFSSAGHRIKLLLFESAGGKSWELQEQEDSIPTHQGTSLAGLFLGQDKTYCIRPGKGGPEAKMNAENQLFKRLDTMAPREHISVQPGNVLLAVYNDNWFKRAQFRITAFQSREEGTSREAISEVQSLETKLLEIQSSVHKFQKDYLKAQEEWQRAMQRFETLKLEMDQTLKQRDDAYLKLLGASQSHANSDTPRQSILPGWGSQR